MISFENFDTVHIFLSLFPLLQNKTKEKIETSKVLTIFSERTVEGIYPHYLQLLDGLPKLFLALAHLSSFNVTSQLTFLMFIFT